MIENYFNVDTCIIPLYEVQCAIQLLPILITTAAAVGWFLKKWLWKTEPTPKTTHIAILGRKASGKTTLWNKLHGYAYSGDYKVTARDKLAQFTIERGGKEVIIESPEDIGGDKNWVHVYGNLIKEGTFILFLVDATDYCSDAKKDVRSRVQCIQKTINDNKLDNVGFHIYVTHADEYLQKNPGMTKAEIINKVKDFLDLESVRVSKQVCYEYTAVNLTCDEDINDIKKKLIDRVYE